MNILYITDPGIVGGATRSLVDVVSAMKSRGVECLVCTSAQNELNEELTRLGIGNFASGHRSAMDTSAYTWWKKPLKKLVKGLDYHMSLSGVLKGIEDKLDLSSIDLIHTNSARNDIGCLLSQKYGIPHLMHIREFGQEDFGCICYRRDYEKFINAGTTRFVAISRAVRDAWVKKGLDPNKVTVIYNGVDDTKILPRPEQSRDDGFLRLVIVGGVCEAKGQGQIVEAMGLLPPDVREHVRLDIVGWEDPAYRARIERRSQELGVSEFVRFLGARSDVYKILQNYDVGLTCSRAEGFGRVTAEYMHARLGVIASDTGANPELIGEGEGLLYPLEDAKALAERICTFYRDRALLEKMAQAGFEKARAHYTKQINADNLYALYHEILTQ